MSNQLPQTASPSDNLFSSLLLGAIDQNDAAVSNGDDDDSCGSSNEGGNPCVQQAEFSSDEEMEDYQPVPAPSRVLIGVNWSGCADNSWQG